MQNLGLKDEHWKILSLMPMKNIFYEENFSWKEKEKDFNYFNWMSFFILRNMLLKNIRLKMQKKLRNFEENSQAEI